MCAPTGGMHGKMLIAYYKMHCRERSRPFRGLAIYAITKLAALRPEMTALPRNCPQMSNDIYARPRDVEDAVTYKNQEKVWHKICRRGKP